MRKFRYFYCKKATMCKLLLFFLLIISSVYPSLNSQANETKPDKKPNTQLKVGTKIFPPFAMKNSKGEWTGISIELWQEIARQLNLNYQWQEYNLKSLLNNIGNSNLDVAIAALTITAEREKTFDFSHTYYSTGLSIAIPRTQGNGWLTVLNGLFSLKMLMIIAALFSVLFVIGTLTWLIERKRNSHSFNPDPIRGIASGIWWAAVTMTTVGYGDMTPKTLGGRLIALFWMFASLLLVSAVIASVASTLTLSKIEPLVSGPEDLARARIASIENSTSDQYLKSRHLSVRYFNSVSECLHALKDKKVDAVVYDEPLLKYLVKKHFADSLEIDDSLFDRQHYGIAFPEGSPLRESVNRVMLEILQGDKWQKILAKYLGN